MAIEVQSKVGPIQAGDGTLIDPRLARDGAAMVGDLHGRMYEQTSRGQVFVASTPTAGAAPGTVLTASGFLSIANPANSGYNIAILRALIAYVSGTLGIGTMCWAAGVNPGALPAETVAAVRVTTLGGVGNSGDVAKAYGGVSLTTVPTLVRPTPIQLIPYAGGVAPLTMSPMLFEDVAGELVIPPGYFMSLQGIAAAGTSPIIMGAITYELVRP